MHHSTNTKSALSQMKLMSQGKHGVFTFTVQYPNGPSLVFPYFGTYPYFLRLLFLRYPPIERRAIGYWKWYWN